MRTSVVKRSAPVLMFLVAGACGSGDDSAGNGDRNGGSQQDGGAGGGLDGEVFGPNDGLPDANVNTAPPTTPDVCADIETTPVRTIPSVTFLVDGSGSMECAYPEVAGANNRCALATGAQQSRWQALGGALLGESGSSGVIDSLGSSIRFGFWIYNQNRGGGMCPNISARVAPELNQLDAVKSAFPAKPPGDNTPTALALAELIKSLPNAEEAKAQKLGPQKIVLATDGEPYVCQQAVEFPALDYAGVISAVDEARKKGIDIYVVSLAPTAGDFATHLDEVASKGGTSKPYAPANKAELNAALDDIIASAISCTVELSGKIDRPQDCNGTVTLGTDALSCGDSNGFRIVDESHVELTGAACQRFKHEPNVALKVSFPCGAFGLE